MSCYRLDLTAGDARDRTRCPRRTRYLRARLQLAHPPYITRFNRFDFSFQPLIDEHQIRGLQMLRFVHEASNVIFLGPPGVGRTHLSVALSNAAIQAGFDAYSPRTIW